MPSLTFNLNDKAPDTHLIEDSVPLRVVTTLMALIGILVAAQLTDSPGWLHITSILGCIVGSWLSYKRRYQNNLIGKIWISVGILMVAGLFFNELLVRVQASVADARTPLTEMLMALTALHSFDLPRRRDLSLSALVGLVLLTSASSLSRDLGFLFYFAVFFVLAIYMFKFDCASRTLSRAFINSTMPADQALSARVADAAPSSSDAKFLRKRSSLSAKRDLIMARTLVAKSDLPQKIRSAVIISGAVIAVTMLCFALAPRLELRMFNQIRIASNLNLPFGAQVTTSSLNMGQILSPDGSIHAQPNAYFGFAEILDTNYRGTLGDRVVLRVHSPRGTYLRGMSYDKFDGQLWRMNKPKDTTDCLAIMGNRFDLPLKNAIFPKVRYKELTQIIYVEEDSSNLVVCASVPFQIYFPSSKLQIDKYGGIRSPVGMQKDMVYTVFSNMPIYEYAQLRKLTQTEEKHLRMKRKLSSYLELPKLDARIADVSKMIAGNGSDFSKAENLCNYLLSQYKYDLSVPASTGGIDTVSDFLFNKKRGYCEHFASALAIMCRTQGIPARLVTGYVPGQFNPFTGLWDIRLCDAHSWTEVFIPGAGWVPMDPTPGGMGVEFQSESPNSISKFIETELERAWKKFEESPQGKRFSKDLETTLEKAGAVLGSASKFMSTILTVGIVIASLWSVFWIKAYGFSFGNIVGRFKKKPMAEEDIVSLEASREYMETIRLLKIFDVNKLPGDTASDIISKIQTSSRAKELEEAGLTVRCQVFFDTYSRVRFGYYDELSKLKTEAAEIAKLAETLTVQRSSASIS